MCTPECRRICDIPVHMCSDLSTYGIWTADWLWTCSELESAVRSQNSTFGQKSTFGSGQRFLAPSTFRAKIPTLGWNPGLAPNLDFWLRTAIPAGWQVWLSGRASGIPAGSCPDSGQLPDSCQSARKSSPGAIYRPLSIATLVENDWGRWGPFWQVRLTLALETA